MPTEPVWIVAPHASFDYDEWWRRARTPEDARAALDYARARLEEVWDECELGSGPRTVTIELREVDSEEIPEDAD